MASREELLVALRAAHAAGNAEHATRIAGMLATAPATTPTQTPQPALQDTAGAFTEDMARQPPQQALPTQPAASTTPATNFPVRVGGNAGFLEELEKEPWYAKAVAGLGTAPAQAWQSIKQMAGQEVPKADIEAQRAIADTGPGMVGNLAGNIAMLAVPGGKATELAQGARATAAALPKATQAAADAVTGLDKVRMFAAPAAVAGTEAAALTPTLEDETRLGNAAKAAFFTKALQGAGKIVSGAVEPTKQALELIKQGIMPTVGQGGKGAVGSTLGYIEDVLASLPPILGGSVFRKGQKRAEDEAVDIAARRAEPPPVRNVGQPQDVVGRGEHFKQQTLDYNTAYDDVLSGKSIPVTGLFRTQAGKAGRAELTGVPKHMVNKFEEDMKNYIPSHTGRVSGETWKEAQNNVRQRAREAAEDYAKSGRSEDRAMSKAYNAVDEHLKKIRNKGMTKDEVKQLEAVDEAWAHNVLMETAASYPRQAGDRIGITNVIKAVEQETPDYLKVRNMGRLQDITEPAKQVFGKEAGRDVFERKVGYLGSAAVLGTGAGMAGLAPFLAPALALGYAGVTKPGAKVLMGQTDVQRKLAEQLRKPYAKGVMEAFGGTEAQRD